MIDHFRKTRAALVSLYELSKSSNHSVVTGNLRENFARGFLEDHLASNVSWSSGQIIGQAPENSLSGQLDIILHSANHPRFNFFDKYVRVVPADAAIATIEVKSSLTTGRGTTETLTQAMDSMYGAKMIARGNNINRQDSVPFYIISFHTPARVETVVEHVENYLLSRHLQPARFWPDAIVCLSGPKSAPAGFGVFKATCPVLFPSTASALVSKPVPLSKSINGLNHSGIHLFQCGGDDALGVFVAALSNLSNQFEADDFSLERYLYECGYAL